MKRIPPSPIDFSKISSKEIASHISQLPLTEIPPLLVAINEKNDPEWKAKTRAVIVGLESRPSLEAAGNSLSFSQIEELLGQTLTLSSQHLWKLSPILVGLPPRLFQEILNSISEKNLQVFKDEAVTEPVQHQLTLFGHTIQEEISLLVLHIDRFIEKICTLNIEETSLADYMEYTLQIETFTKNFQKLENQANKALAIAWNTHRLDLIETFNHAKETCHRSLNHSIGKPRKASFLSTGLYEKLDKKIFSLFGDPFDPRQSDALRDSEPAIEALTKFSLWYLRDYWAIGLLPKIKQVEDIDSHTKTEAERVKRREELFAEVVSNLAHLGLHTVKDLKDHLIFSKKSLQDFIQTQLAP